MGGSNEQEIAEGAAAAGAGAELGDDPSAMRSMKDFVGGHVREYAELSPVFLQFLDLVHNLLAQFPTAFEITEGLLTFIAEHAFRCGEGGVFVCLFVCPSVSRFCLMRAVTRTAGALRIVSSCVIDFGVCDDTGRTYGGGDVDSVGWVGVFGHCGVPTVVPHNSPLFLSTLSRAFLVGLFRCPFP